MYSLRQAAEALGMTRQGLKYWLDRLGEPLVKDDISGRYVVSDDALQSVKQARESASEAASEVINNAAGRPITKRAAEAEIKAIPPGASASEAASEAEAVALEVLREQIAVKDAQIAEKDEQIRSLNAQLENISEALRAAQRSLEGEQRLHAASMIKQLQGADVQYTVEDVRPSPPESEAGDPIDRQGPETKRRGFFGWLRRSR